MKHFYWMRPIYILKPENEGYVIPNALLVVGRRTEIMDVQYNSETKYSKAVPRNHRYYFRLNLWIVVIEHSFIWPKNI